MIEKLPKVGYTFEATESHPETLVKRIRGKEKYYAEIWKVRGKDNRQLFLTKLFSKKDRDDNDEICPDLFSLKDSIKRAEKLVIR